VRSALSPARAVPTAATHNYRGTCSPRRRVSRQNLKRSHTYSRLSPSPASTIFARSSISCSPLRIEFAADVTKSVQRFPAGLPEEHGRRFPYRTLYAKGFSRFVTSTTAPVATGRSETRRTGFAPAERQHLGTAHDKVEPTTA
jgi:hypothetical protein